MGWMGIAQSGFDTAMEGALGAAEMKAGYKYAKKMAVHKYPWMIESLNRAGLNPLLAVGGAQPGPSSVQLAGKHAGKSNLALDSQVDANRAAAENQRSQAALTRVRTAAEQAELPRKQIQEQLTSELLSLVKGAKSWLTNPETQKAVGEWFRKASEFGASTSESYSEGVRDKLRVDWTNPFYNERILRDVPYRGKDVIPPENRSRKR